MNSARRMPGVSRTRDNVERLQCTNNEPMLVRRLFGSVAFFLIALCSVASARADESPRVSLKWSAPAECPTREVVLEEVDRLLGTRAASDERALDAVAEVQRKDDGSYVVRLEIPRADGPRQREVSAVSCGALGQAAALILAMMIDPEAALSAPPAPGSSGTTPKGQTPVTPGSPGQTAHAETKSEVRLGTSSPMPVGLLAQTIMVPAPSFEGPRKSVEERWPRPTFSVSLQVVGDVGSLPGPAFGFGGVVGVFPGQWRFGLGFAQFLEKSDQFIVLPKSGSHVNLTSFHGTMGRAFLVHPKIELAPRIRLDLARFQATSFGVTEVGEGSGVAFGMGAGGALSVGLTQYFRAVLGFDAVVLLAYPSFVVKGVGVAHEPQAVVWRLSTGFELRF